MALNHFISIGGLLSVLSYYGFFLGLLLAYANYNQRFIYIGMFAYGALEAIDFIRFAAFAGYRFIDFYSLITCLIFLSLGYKVFKYDSSLNKNF